MNAVAAVLFVIACLAELGGVGLIVREAGAANRVMVKWMQADNPANEGRGTNAQTLLVNEAVRTLLGARVRVFIAVALVVVGIVAGTVGNFLTL